jgi:hypothetical protein
MAGEINVTDPQEILSLYTPDRWREELPKLSAASCLAIEAYFEENGVENIAGLTANGEWQPHHVDLLKRLAAPAVDNRADWVGGPYLLGGTYYPQGVGIWASNKTAELSQN